MGIFSLPNRNFPGPEHCPPNEKFQSLESNMNMQASPPLPTQNVMSQTYNMQDVESQNNLQTNVAEPQTQNFH